MGIGLGVHGRMRALQMAPEHGAALLLTTLLFMTALGCETQRGEQESASTQRGGDSKAKADAGTGRGTKREETVAAQQDTKSKGSTNRVRLTDQGCVQFDQRWTTVRVGQALTWQSDLESPVTIHVSPGAFDRVEYVVRAGGSVSTGPARSPGSYSVWTEPAACQDMPRGVQGSGPGVIVEGATQP